MNNTRIIRLKHINMIRKAILNACLYNGGVLHPLSVFFIIVLVIVIVTMIHDTFNPSLGRSTCRTSQCITFIFGFECSTSAAPQTLC